MGKFLERTSLGALKNSVPGCPAVVQTQANAAAGTLFTLRAKALRMFLSKCSTGLSYSVLSPG